MRVLVACEFSGIVREAFRARGWDAVSCDLMPSEIPGQHVRGDVVPLLSEPWDLVVAFPPCAHLAVSGAKHFAAKRADGRQQQGIDFFSLFTRLDHVPRVAIENPVGIMSRLWRKPDQIIQPWQFGHEAQKSTCLWLKGLPPLRPTAIVGRGAFYVSPRGKRLPAWYGDAVGASGRKIAYGSAEMKAVRSRTFPGIAAAMAAQWTNEERAVCRYGTSRAASTRF